MTPTELKTNLKQACLHEGIHFPANKYDETFLDFLVSILLAAKDYRKYLKEDPKIDFDFMIYFARTVKLYAEAYATRCVGFYYNVIVSTLGDVVKNTEEVTDDLCDIFNL